MAKSKTSAPETNEEKKLSGFHNIVEEKTVHGIVASFGKLPSKEEGKEFVYIEFEDGSKLACSSQLMSLIHNANNDESIGFNIGDEIKVNFVEKRKTKNGYFVNVLQLFVNNKEVKPAEISKDSFLEFIGTGLPF